MSKKNGDMPNPFKRAEEIRLLEYEISLNANEVNNCCIAQPDTFRESISTSEPIMEWYLDKLKTLRYELIQYMNNAEIDYLKLKTKGNECK